ncbi:MAG: glycoside hydrolase family 13 protein [Bacillota bacterium]|nr:glycoside hydrolase family 13 protein [Bacillota bacterium]
MRILYDSKSQLHKRPFGCLRQNEICQITIFIPKSCSTKRVLLVLEAEDGFSLTVPFVLTDHTDDYEHYSGKFSIYRKGLYYYYFKVETEDTFFSLYKEGYKDTNMEYGSKWQLTCYDEDADTPDEFRGTVFYQIFPDRFNKAGLINPAGKLTPYRLHENLYDVPEYKPNDEGQILNNDFYGGNLKGIIDKLPYLQELGVGAIYLNPIFKAFSNHRYDTCDFKKVDPLLGTEEDFKELCSKCHSKNIKVILDGVFSHVGSNSIYFDINNIFGSGAYHNHYSRYIRWFNFEVYPKKYKCWWGIKTLPCVDELTPEYMNYIIYDEDSVISHWLNAGADGFRLDVADELPDEFIIALRKKVKEIKPSGLILGEVWEDASNKKSYGIRRRYFSEFELDSVMNYPMRDVIIQFINGSKDGTYLAQTLMTICENYPQSVIPCLMNILSTHDTPRIINLLSDIDIPKEKEKRAYSFLLGEEFKKAVAREKLASFIQFVIPGSPCIYYGDEAGLQGYEDPFNRKFFPWDNINEELLSHYKRMANLKNSYESLKTGEAEIINAKDGIFHLMRKSKNEIVKAAANRGAVPYSVTFKKLIYLENCHVSNDIITVGQNGFVLYQ